MTFQKLCYTFEFITGTNANRIIILMFNVHILFSLFLFFDATLNFIHFLFTLSVSLSSALSFFLPLSSSFSIFIVVIGFNSIGFERLFSFFFQAAMSLPLQTNLSVMFIYSYSFFHFFLNL